MDGNATSFGYDDHGNVNFVTQNNWQAGTQTDNAFKYNPYGDLIEATDSDKNVRTIRYNATGHSTGTSFTWTNPADPAETKTVATGIDVGPDSQPDSNTDATGDSAVTLYDELGRGATQVVDATLDADGNYVAGTGWKTTTTYDKRGLLIQSLRQTLDENSNVAYLATRSHYDAAGRLTDQTNEYRSDSAGNPLPGATVQGSETIYDSTTGLVTETKQLDVSPARGRCRRGSCRPGTAGRGRRPPARRPARCRRRTA